MVEIVPRSNRDGVRWGLLLAAVAATGFRLPRTYGEFRDWQSVRFSDPSAAELYRLAFTANVLGIVIILGLAAVVFYLLRPRMPKQP